MRENCFAHGNGGCAVLIIKTCPGEKCTFYKSSERAAADRARAKARLLTLDEQRQQYISDTYYGGKPLTIGSAVMIK